PLERRTGRKGASRYGEFEFERIGANRIEHMGFDFQYGDRPDVWLCLAVWTGERGVCTLFRTGNCWNYSAYRKPYRLWVVSQFRREPLPQHPLAEALAKGLRRLQVAEAYFREGADHPDLGLTQTLPPYQWPDGYADRMK
ncbi:hypothetical protein, partial [uncultured Phenylobacterium sp.]|uniref:hypothetical protein n=1 Tax=uncultured Phenylobacterium sp. TaxID=349273 RepID=UPI0025E70C3F